MAADDMHFPNGPVITVTGSRVITNNLNSPTPITAVSTEQLLATIGRVL